MGTTHIVGPLRYEYLCRLFVIVLGHFTEGKESLAFMTNKPDAEIYDTSWLKMCRGNRKRREKSLFQVLTALISLKEQGFYIRIACLKKIMFVFEVLILRLKNYLNFKFLFRFCIELIYLHSNLP